MGKHFSHLTPTQRTQIDAFVRAGMKVVDIAKEIGVHYTTIYRELKRCTYEHLNKNQNGLIRRLVPKGTDLATLSPQEVKAAEAWLNSYPRKMFGFLCSEQLFREELALIMA